MTMTSISFEQFSHIALVFSLLTLKKQMLVYTCFYWYNVEHLILITCFDLHCILDFTFMIETSLRHFSDKIWFEKYY